MRMRTKGWAVELSDGRKTEKFVFAQICFLKYPGAGWWTGKLKMGGGGPKMILMLHASQQIALVSAAVWNERQIKLKAFCLIRRIEWGWAGGMICSSRIRIYSFSGSTTMSGIPYSKILIYIFLSFIWCFWLTWSSFWSSKAFAPDPLQTSLELS